MRVVVFAVADRTIALKLEGIEKILSPGETAPAGRTPIDLAAHLGLHVSENPGETYGVLLACGGACLTLGRPLGTARIEAAWIVPLPGYIFAGGEAPYRGLIDVTGRKVNDATRRLLDHTLLLDEERIGRFDWSSAGDS